METGFPVHEYRARLARVQAGMEQAGLSALLLTTEADVRYLTGYLTRFWESPTRPWFLVVPLHGEPVAVIPAIGAALMATTWVEDIRTWRAPDYQDDGVGLLAQTLKEVTPRKGRIGTPCGNGTHLRMPLGDWARLHALCAPRVFEGDAGVMCAQRMLKSDAEIAKIAEACRIAGRAFARVEQVADVGVPLAQVFRQFQMLCLDEGADWVPYLAGGAGQGGYADVISPASQNPLAEGDVLMLDTGLVWDGYFCDFDRNFALCAPSPEVHSAHARLVEATVAAFEIARPGRTAAELFAAMDAVVTGGAGGSDAGRLGHGLGMQLTEPPSLIPSDHAVLEPGMVLTLEPGIDMGNGRLMVHEENIVIRDGAPEWLSPPAGPEIAVIGS
ncbi:MAG: Xaa-Pro peptidase family protein [Roseobacter sp.]|jgi:Xaa-Pro dipeptidase|nr:Xaa-Pro peptidase family protein [Roseobacter sp.]